MTDTNDDWVMYQTPKEVQAWADGEIRQVARALDLRVREVLQIATACASGEIDTKRAEELTHRYYDRWDDALPSLPVTATDDEIYKAIDGLHALQSNGGFTERLERGKDNSSRKLP